MGFEIFANFETIRVLMYLIDFPEGRQRVDIRRDLNISSTTQIKAIEILFNLGFIENKPDISKLLFGLTPIGLEIANLMLNVDEKIKNLKLKS